MAHIEYKVKESFLKNGSVASKTIGTTTSESHFLTEWACFLVSNSEPISSEEIRASPIPFDKDDLTHLAQSLKWELEYKHPDKENVRLMGWLFSIVGGCSLTDESKFYICCTWGDERK